jgi:glycine/D-amino acid oxidase-like deaminating enzyme
VRDSAEIDVAVLGGGIAGLWVLNRLRRLGFDALLFEKAALGSGQTLASQGIIHSGVKYAFDNVVRPQTQSLSSMPKIWMDCIAGTGEVDLRGADVLANNQLIFTTGGLTSQIASTVASRALRSAVHALERDEFPEIFHTSEFQGKVFRLQEPVLATKSLLAILCDRAATMGGGHPVALRARVKELRRQDASVAEIVFDDAQETRVRPRACVFTSGQGNEWFAEQLGLDKNKITQRRPLRMFLARGLPYRVYAHWLVPEYQPRVTITTHDWNGEPVWYIGGGVSEKAVGRSDAEALRMAHAEMAGVFPWLDWKRVQWAIHDVNRAEPSANKLLPGGATIRAVGNAALAWPTKLALAPALADQVLRWLEEQNISPSNKSTQLPLAPAEPGKYPWEEVREWIHL